MMLINMFYPDDTFIRCSSCGSPIEQGEVFYDVNGLLFCGSCEDAAKDAIIDLYLEDHRSYM